jgi:hypothetical protein
MAKSCHNASTALISVQMAACQRSLAMPSPFGVESPQ